MKKFLSIIRASRLFSGISESDTAEMLQCLGANTKTFKKSTFIFHAGDTTEAIGLLLEGEAFIVQEDFWGNRNIIAGIIPGQTFAETFACVPESTMNVNVIAQSDCTVLFLNVSRILTTCTSPCAHHSQIIRNLLSELASKNLTLNEKVVHLSQRTTRTKLLSYLSAKARENGSFKFDIPFSRQQMADYLSVERSGLSLELSKMKKEGLLDFRKNHFVLKR